MSAAFLTDYDPSRSPGPAYAWSAVSRDYEPGYPMGFGRTEAEAIDDLLEQQFDAEVRAENRADDIFCGTLAEIIEDQRLSHATWDGKGQLPKPPFPTADGFPVRA